MRRLQLSLLAFFLFGGVVTSAAADESELPTVDVAGPDELPPLPPWDWAAVGNLQFDGLAYSDLGNSDREKDLQLRRARLSGLLQWRVDWLFKAGIDFSDGPEMREMSIEYRGSPVFIEFGRIVEPFGVLQGGSRASAFMERPQATALAPGYGLGLGVNTRGERWSFTGGIYSATKNDVFDEGGREENALTARATWTPLRREESLIHLGGAVSHRESDGGLLQFVAIPESVLLVGLNTNSELLVTGAGSDTGYFLYGLEFAALHGPLLVQSEYMNANLAPVLAIDFESEDFIVAAEPSYSSWYVEAAWAVTGERRDYSSRRGVIGGINPSSSIDNGGWGALELALRHGNIDLSDEKIGGERGRVSAVGLNWFPNPVIKIMLNGLRIREMREHGSEAVTAVQARVQVYFSAP